MTGPSTNFYVGPQGVHCTIPKRLLYHFSDYARVCLEGHFSEADANAIWLSDIDPDIFQWLWQWLYNGELEVHRLHHWNWKIGRGERLEQVCQVLCRVHILGERLFFDSRLLVDSVQRQLDAVIEEAKAFEEYMPLTPKIVEEVLLNSAPVQYGGSMSWASPSLRPSVLRHLCDFQFCTTVEFLDYVECFERDGAFAAEIMGFLASELKWAVNRWEEQIDSPVDVRERKKRIAEGEGSSQCLTMRFKTRQGAWLALRYIPTFVGCITIDFRVYSRCFEIDGEFAAGIMHYMAQELLWIVEIWGEERGSTVDVAAEKEEEARIAQEESDLQHMVDRIMRRDGWS